MKKILITGGDGFIAKNFYEKLNGNYEIISCNRSMLDLNDSLSVYNYLKRELFDVIIHTATYDAAPKDSPKAANRVLENNLKMFFNITRCKDYFGKMIYFGSGAEFDREKWIPKMKESYFDRHVPKDQYGLSKYIMTKYAYLSDNIFNLRLFGMYGKYDDWRYRFISNVCCYAVMGMPIKIHKNSRVDFLYIDDLVKLVEWFIDNKPKYQVYNICSGDVFDFSEWAKKIIAISGKKLDLVVNNDDGECREYSGDNALLLKELSGFKFSSAEQSLSSLYNWYEENKHKIDITKSHY